MFDDWERISLTLITSVPRMWASWMTRSATWIVGASVNVLVGETTLSSSAPAIVTILKVEPGSYASVTARLRRASGDAVEKWLASNVG